jgi:hypothetical protein
VTVGGIEYPLRAVAQKRGLVVYECPTTNGAPIPDYQTRRKIDLKLTQITREHIIIFTDSAQKTQIWQWVKREPGRPVACREHTYRSSQTGEGLLQKLSVMAVSLDDEETFTLMDATTRVRAAFDVDKVTKRFYERFKTEHTAFLKFIKGIENLADREWYASLMLNRLMFIYFIQRKGFLDGDRDYLRSRMVKMRLLQGKDKFLSFYRHFLLRLFHEGLGAPARDSDLDALLGRVPFLNGGLFDTHKLEEDPHGKEIVIPDKAFEKLFAFFDDYDWHLDERPLRKGNEINPDVLGYIFEKYINQKQMGAYYTKEDITEYIAKNTIIPYLFDAAQKKCEIAFRPESALWRLLRDDPDRYIYPAMKHGVLDDKGNTLPLPPAVVEGLNDVSKRGGWNRPTSEEYGLPTETWREHVARRKRCLEIREKLKAGEVHAINDLVTYNLDIRQFAQDAIESCEGPELLRAFYYTIAGRAPQREGQKPEPGMSVLDPTCGSGAFLFAALNVLEPLYEACLDRMEAFVTSPTPAPAEGAAEGETTKNKRETFTDFRRIRAEVDDHANERYFILKRIIIGNLYGVDIMEEAVEICKLRLFLKLVAQLERIEEIEPLPDIDFNVRAGNTLIGFTSIRALSDTMIRDRRGNLRVMTSEEEAILADISVKAAAADEAFQQFRAIQSARHVDADEAHRAKSDLTKRLQTLSVTLDRHLAGEYGINSRNADSVASRSFCKSVDCVEAGYLGSKVT